MTLEQLRKVHQTRPFVPFTLRTADGNQYAVQHPEFLAFMQTGRSIFVATPDGAYEIIDVMMVTSIHVANGEQAESRPKKSD